MTLKGLILTSNLKFLSKNGELHVSCKSAMAFLGYCPNHSVSSWLKSRKIASSDVLHSLETGSQYGTESYITAKRLQEALPTITRRRNVGYAVAADLVLTKKIAEAAATPEVHKQPTQKEDMNVLMAKALVHAAHLLYTNGVKINA